MRDFITNEILKQPDGFNYESFYQFLKSRMKKKDYEYIEYTLENCQKNSTQNIQFIEVIKKLIISEKLPEWFLKEIQEIISGKSE